MAHSVQRVVYVVVGMHKNRKGENMTTEAQCTEVYTRDALPFTYHFIYVNGILYIILIHYSSVRLVTPLNSLEKYNFYTKTFYKVSYRLMLPNLS